MNEYYILIHDDHLDEVTKILTDLFKQDKIRYLIPKSDET